MKNLQLIYKKQPTSFFLLLGLSLLLLASIAWAASSFTGYSSSKTEVDNLASEIDMFRVKTVYPKDGSFEVEQDDLASDDTHYKIKEVELALKSSKKYLEQLSSNYEDLFSKVGFASVSLPDMANFEPVDFKDTFYDTQTFLIDEALKTDFILTDSFFGFDIYKEQLPKREELEVLYSQLQYAKELILFMIKTDIRALKGIELITPTKISLENSDDPLLNEYRFKFSLECFTPGLVDFLLDINKLDHLYLVNDLQVTSKSDGTELISADIDVSAIEAIELKKKAKRKVSAFESSITKLYKLLKKRDIFNAFRVAKKIPSSKPRVHKYEEIKKQPVPIYKGYIKLSDGRLIGQVNLENRTYFAVKGSNIANFVVKSISESKLILFNNTTNSNISIYYTPRK